MEILDELPSKKPQEELFPPKPFTDHSKSKAATLTKWTEVTIKELLNKV